MLKTEKSLLNQNARANSYKLLADCYYLPDEQLLQRLHNLVEPISESCIALSKDAPDKNELELLQVDFSKLFIGPFKLLAPPYGSVYLENKREILGDSTIDVRDRYRQEGLDIALKEVPDHIAIELEFMYFLVVKEMEAVENSDYERIIEYQKKQASLLHSHLINWVSEFADRVMGNAKTKFYKNLAQATKAFVVEDLNSLT